MAREEWLERAGWHPREKDKEEEEEEEGLERVGGGKKSFRLN